MGILRTNTDLATEKVALKYKELWQVERMLESHIEQILAPSEVEGSGFFVEGSALLEQVSNVLAGEGLEAKGVLDGAGDGIGPFRFTQY